MTTAVPGKTLMKCNFYLSISFSVVHRLLVLSRFSPYSPVYWTSDFKFIFIILSNSFSRFISGRRRRRRRLPGSDHFNIRLDHQLSSMRTTCPYHFNIFPVVHRMRIIPRYVVIFCG